MIRTTTRSSGRFPSTVAGRYVLVEKIGGGSFGDIYLGLDKENGGEEVAVKLAHASEMEPCLLSLENKVYKRLDGFVGIPRARWFGQETQYNALVMDLLGPSLEDLFQLCSQRFSLKTVLMLADQMILRLEAVHSKSLVHRDIKPENFLMGVGKYRHKVFLVDFGLAKCYLIFPYHMLYKDNKPFQGTLRYASIYAHLGVEQSRRDDLESLGYIFVYFLTGSLPWLGLQASTKKQMIEQTVEKKMSVCVEELCIGLPREFKIYLKHCRNLRFEEKPKYDYLRYLFRVLFRFLGHKYDYMYDWRVLNEKSGDPSHATQSVSPSTRESSEKCSNCDGDHWRMQCPFKDKNDRQFRTANMVGQASASERGNSSATVSQHRKRQIKQKEGNEASQDKQKVGLDKNLDQAPVDTGGNGPRTPKKPEEQLRKQVEGNEASQDEQKVKSDSKVDQAPDNTIEDNNSRTPKKCGEQSQQAE